MSKGYGVQIFLACAFTSVSIHLLNQRRDAQSERLRHSAQIGALEDVLQRLRSGETVSDAELVKIRRRVGISQRDANSSLPAATANPNPGRWKDTFTKRKELHEEITDDQLLSEWNKAIRDSEASADVDRPSLLQTLFRNQNTTDNNSSDKRHAVAHEDGPKQVTQSKPTQSNQNPKKPLFYY